MFKYKHILLATDFSDDCEKVAKKAYEMAKLMRAKFSLIHIVEPLPGYGYAYVGSADVEMQLLKEAKKRMVEMGKKFSVSKVRQHVEIGPTKTEITRIAAEKKVDLIIVGSHGRHGLALLLGSTANSVVHHADCDVLTVRIK